MLSCPKLIKGIRQKNCAHLTVNLSTEDGMFSLSCRLRQHFPAKSRSAALFLASFSSASSTSTSFSSLLQGHVPERHLLQLHARIFIFNAHQDDLIATRLIGRYPYSRARRVFSLLQNPNIFPFNAIIRILAQDGLFFDAFSAFKALKLRSLSPNDFTFSFLVNACSRCNEPTYLKQIHTHISKSGFLSDPIVCNSVLAVYSKTLRDLHSALQLFDEMPDRGMVTSWTHLIAAHAHSGQCEEVLQRYCAMLEENLSPKNDTMVSVLSACSTLKGIQVENWVKILSRMVNYLGSCAPARNSVNTILIYLHGKLGNVEKSREKFDEIDATGKLSVLPWNGMIGAYVQNGCPAEALGLFRVMMEDPRYQPNHVTMVSVLPACAQIGDLELGIQVHEYMKMKGRKGVLGSNRILATAFIDMYSKCGQLEKAKEVFNQMAAKDVVSFNAMIMGLALNGEGEKAVSLFSTMLDSGLHPNAGTFLGVLYACSHSGLSNEGEQVFLDMSSRFSVPPEIEHYACYIDLLARVGRIEEALRVVDTMPYEPNNFIWGALLGGCLLHSRSDLAEVVHRKLADVDPESSGGYVMLANAFAVDRRWSEVSMLRWLMREHGIKKQPGQSWISINGAVHEFLACSPSHPEMKSIYQTLEGLLHIMKVGRP